MFYFVDKPKYMTIDWSQAKAGACIDFQNTQLGKSGHAYIMKEARKNGIILESHVDSDNTYFFVKKIMGVDDSEDILGLIKKNGPLTISQACLFMGTTNRNLVAQKMNGLVTRGYLIPTRSIGDKGGRPTTAYSLREELGL